MTTDPRAAVGPPAYLKDLNDQLMDGDEVPLDVLVVAGRRSGLPRRTPLTVAAFDGHPHVVGGFPAAEWIRNVRASGGCATMMWADGTRQEVVLVQVDRVAAEALLRTWPQVTPDGVAMMQEAGVIRGTDPDSLAEAAAVCPVFRVEPKETATGE